VLFYLGVKLVSVLREEHRAEMLKNRVLGKMLGAEKEEVTGEGENCIMRNIMTCTVTKYYSGDQIKRV
jgi:hypothetical protein